MKTKHLKEWKNLQFCKTYSHHAAVGGRELKHTLLFVRLMGCSGKKQQQKKQVKIKRLQQVDMTLADRTDGVHHAELDCFHEPME